MWNKYFNWQYLGKLEYIIFTWTRREPSTRIVFSLVGPVVSSTLATFVIHKRRIG